VPRADGIALVGAHLGRAQKFRVTLDPSILSEWDPFGTDPELDMFNPENGPPYKPEWARAVPCSAEEPARTNPNGAARQAA